jgi:restriction system protein
VAEILYGIGTFGIPGIKVPDGLWGLAKLAAYAVALSGLFSWFTKFEHRGQATKKNKGFGPLAKLSWEQFEQFLADAYRRRGYEVDETAASAHGFVDFVLHKKGETIYVQAKHWKSRPVSIHLLRDLYRSMAGEAHRWVVVSMHGFTDEAKDWARGRDIQLMDGDDLVALLGTAAVTGPVAAVGVAEAVASQAMSTPTCPQCGAAMVLHANHHSGASFWGCSTFPTCTGTKTASTVEVVGTPTDKIGAR